MGVGPHLASGAPPHAALTGDVTDRNRTDRRCYGVPKREPPGAPMAGATVVVVVCATDALEVGEPVEPKREPAGAPMAGATVVVGVVATTGAGTGVTVGAGAVDTGVGSDDVVVGAVDAVAVAAPAAAGDVEMGVVGLGTACPPAKAATVPPTVPTTTARATPASTIRCLMHGMLRPVHQPLANAPAISCVGPRRPPRPTLYTRRRTAQAVWRPRPWDRHCLGARTRGRTWISRTLKPSVN